MLLTQQKIHTSPCIVFYAYGRWILCPVIESVSQAGFLILI